MSKVDHDLIGRLNVCTFYLYVLMMGSTGFLVDYIRNKETLIGQITSGIVAAIIFYMLHFIYKTVDSSFSKMTSDKYREEELERINRKGN